MGDDASAADLDHRGASAADIPASFAADGSVVVADSRGQLAHRELVAANERLGPRLWSVGPNAWCVVGNGLSNQTFVRGPEGLIAIDTGECVEEMAAAIAQIRTVTDTPIAAVLYTHFHYVAGTTAVFDDAGGPVPVWGHARIGANRRRVGGEVNPFGSRGLIHQFGIRLPADGPDALVNVGLGRAFRMPEHAPYTPGYVAPTDTFSEPATATVAGLRVEFTPAPSDADDSATIWFPDLGVAVNNLVWPALFNVFPIRGEEYRDPRILLAGLDHLAGLGADHLIGAHGPPLDGADHIRDGIIRYRDSIQYLWDQTVRGMNKGLSIDELVRFVQLPEIYHESPLTSQTYGLAEHHVRQIHTGLKGWFDDRDDLLFSLAPDDRARRLIDGFGGPDEVRRQADEALAADDVRWALELASWLVQRELDGDGRADGGTPEDRRRLAAVLRTIAQRTMSANVRNWALTRALELEGRLDLSRLRTHRFPRPATLADPTQSVRVLRVLLDPHAAAGVDEHVAFDFGPDHPTVGLHVRHGVAVPTTGTGAAVTVRTTAETWADLLGAGTALDEAIAAGAVVVEGDGEQARAVLAAFDLPGFSVPADR
ncbi:MAG: alkyl sulfatase dimerization domain-containing protein [Acidimicrobiales bacterium]